jgi:hypothetical protein
VKALRISDQAPQVRSTFTLPQKEGTAAATWYPRTKASSTYKHRRYTVARDESPHSNLITITSLYVQFATFLTGSRHQLRLRLRLHLLRPGRRHGTCHGNGIPSLFSFPECIALEGAPVKAIAPTTAVSRPAQFDLPTVPVMLNSPMGTESLRIRRRLFSKLAGPRNIEQQAKLHTTVLTYSTQSRCAMPPPSSLFKFVLGLYEVSTQRFHLVTAPKTNESY